MIFNNKKGVIMKKLILLAIFAATSANASDWQIVKQEGTWKIFQKHLVESFTPLSDGFRVILTAQKDHKPNSCRVIPDDQLRDYQVRASVTCTGQTMVITLTQGLKKEPVSLSDLPDSRLDVIWDDASQGSSAEVKKHYPVPPVKTKEPKEPRSLRY